MLAAKRPRSAFTLVELMVVVVIIGILAAATTAVAVKVIESQRKSATKFLVDSIANALEAQRSKVIQDARKALGTSGTTIDESADLSIVTEWNKVFDRSSANQSQAYLGYVRTFFPSYPSGNTDFASLFPATVTLNSGDSFSGTEFAKAFHLYLVLKQGRFSSLDPDSLGKSVQFATVTGSSQKIPYLVDQWGDPITLTFPGTATTSSNLPKPQIFSKNL